MKSREQNKISELRIAELERQNGQLAAQCSATSAVGATLEAEVRDLRQQVSRSQRERQEHEASRARLLATISVMEEMVQRTQELQDEVWRLNRRLWTKRWDQVGAHAACNQMAAAPASSLSATSPAYVMETEVLGFLSSDKRPEDDGTQWEEL